MKTHLPYLPLLSRSTANTLLRFTMHPDAETHSPRPVAESLPPLPTEDVAEFVALISAILAENDRMEASETGSSPAPPRLIAKLRAVLIEVQQPEMQSHPEKMAERLGLAPWQDASFKETGLHFVASIREYLRIICFYNEATLRRFGFPSAETSRPGC